MENNQLHPTVSRVLADGTLVELVYDPLARTTALAVQWPDGSRTTEQGLDLAGGSRLVPYSADNDLLAKRCVLLPSAVSDFTSKAALLEDVRAFVHRYVDLSPTFEAIAVHYVL